MKKFKILTAALIVFTLSVSSLLFSMEEAKASTAESLKIAIVDVQKLIESSPEISALKTSRKNDMEILVKFIENAKADVAKEIDETKKKVLEDKYNNELNIRKISLDKEYSKKLSDYDKNITSLISQKAKSLGYNLILTKSSVIDGGVDITSEIIKELK